MCFLSVIALPTPMLTTIFSSRGSESRFSRPSFSLSWADDLLFVDRLQTRSRRRAAGLLFGFFFFLGHA